MIFDTSVRELGVAFTANCKVVQPQAKGAGDEGADSIVLAMRETPAPWLKACLEKIEQLLELHENWDSYGASAVNEDSVYVASSLVGSLANVETIQAPLVTASPEGNVAFCWDDGTQSLDLEVRANGLIRFVYLHEQDSSRELEGITDDASQIAVLLTQW